MQKKALHLATSQDAPASTLGPPPKHFKAAQKLAWRDLVEASGTEHHTKVNRFLFEIAATLVSRFRANEPMNATETKEMKRLLVILGLARADDENTPKKKRNDHYFA